MADYQVAYNQNTKVAAIQAANAALPAGSIKAGTFTHADVEPNIKDLEFGENHVFYHHVRDILYKLGQQDMSIVKITK